MPRGVVYDRGLTPEFGRLTKARRDELGLTPTKVLRRIWDALEALDKAGLIPPQKGTVDPTSYQFNQVQDVEAGKMGAAHLQPFRVEAWCRALEVTNPLDKARWYAAAGHKPVGRSLEQYAEAFEDEEPARAS